MADSKVILTDRTTSPFCAPNTLVLYMRGNTLYMKTETQEEIQVTCSASDITEIKAVTDNLPDSGALTSISDETDKIDGVATDGLLGVSNSLAYRVHEIERHLHSGARWFETASVADPTDHVADEIGSGAGAFTLDSGDQTWGAWVQILGATDTPTVEGKTHFDPHLLSVEDNERAGTYFIQFARGATGDAGLAAGTYTELALDLTTRSGGVIIPVQTGRAPAASLLWARCMTPAFDTGTIEFYIGIHEYEG